MTGVSLHTRLKQILWYWNAETLYTFIINMGMFFWDLITYKALRGSAFSGSPFSAPMSSPHHYAGPDEG